jgi:hypothetical protein
MDAPPGIVAVKQLLLKSLEERNWRKYISQYD